MCSTTKVTLKQLYTATSLCQLAIQEANEAGESPKLYEFLASDLINSHLNGEYEIITENP